MNAKKTIEKFAKDWDLHAQKARAEGRSETALYSAGVAAGLRAALGLLTLEAPSP